MKTPSTIFRIPIYGYVCPYCNKAEIEIVFYFIENKSWLNGTCFLLTSLTMECKECGERGNFPPNIMDELLQENYNNPYIRSELKRLSKKELPIKFSKRHLHIYKETE